MLVRYEVLYEGSMKLWTKQINMYLDFVGLKHKQDPYKHANTPGARKWQLKNEGLKRGCTTKGEKKSSQ